MVGYRAIPSSLDDDNPGYPQPKIVHTVGITGNRNGFKDYSTEDGARYADRAAFAGMFSVDPENDEGGRGVKVARTYTSRITDEDTDTL